MENILKIIQMRRRCLTKTFTDLAVKEETTVDTLYPLLIRIDELMEVEKIIMQCIAAGEDDGK